MAAFLIDYENVNAKNGLDGAEYLKESDRIIIFYSQCCSKIRQDYIDIIRGSGCEFGIHKLLKTGKNGLDFYIASECGMLVQKGETQIVIVSNDKGFEAVSDFFRTRETEDGSMAEIVTAPNIERGLLALHDFNDKKRREQIQKNVNMLDISAEYEKYQAQVRFLRKVEQALKGTEYESMTERVLELVGEQTKTDRKVIYTGALRCFGRKQGTEVYRLVKEAI